MAYIGKSPTAAPLTSSDVTDGIITNAKLAQDIISADTALGATPADTDEFLVSDAGTLKRMDYSYIKAANTPAFNVTLGSAQSISSGTLTKIAWDTETFDTDSAFASNKFTVPSGEGGKYVLGAYTKHNTADDNDTHHFKFYKNGSAFGPDAGNKNFYYDSIFASFIVDASAADYFEVYFEIGASVDLIHGANGCQFFGFKLII